VSPHTGAGKKKYSEFGDHCLHWHCSFSHHYAINPVTYELVEIAASSHHFYLFENNVISQPQLLDALNFNLTRQEWTTHEIFALAVMGSKTKRETRRARSARRWPQQPVGNLELLEWWCPIQRVG
jgi:hypothetical protein